MRYGELGYHPPAPTLTPMKGPAKPLLGVIVSVSGNYVFSFLRNLDTEILLVASGFWNNFTTNVESARQDWTVLIQN